MGYKTEKNGTEETKLHHGTTLLVADEFFKAVLS